LVPQRAGLAELVAAAETTKPCLGPEKRLRERGGVTGASTNVMTSVASERVPEQERAPRRS
jgi:hypothetical protein